MAACAICSDECALPYTVLLRGYGDPVCCHIFHTHCVEPWWRKARTCPECGETFTAVAQVKHVQYLPAIKGGVTEDREADLLAHIRAQLRANGAVPDGEWECAACTLPTPTPPTALASASRAPPAAPSREALRHRARRKREREAQGEAAYRRRSADERAARRLAAKLRERESDEETE